MSNGLFARSLIAIGAGAAHLDDGADSVKARRLRRLADISGQAVVIDMRRIAAIVADQEDTVVQASGVRIGEIGVGAFHPAGEVVRHKQVEDAIDAVRRDALAALDAADLENLATPAWRLFARSETGALLAEVEALIAEVRR